MTRTLRPLDLPGTLPGRATPPLPEEEPVAVVVNGTTLAVMMATPADLEDFALGFALTEGVVGASAEIEELEIVRHPRGTEARLWVTRARAEALAARRRSMAGPVGCGLCGIDSLEQALRPVARVTRETRLPAAEIALAMDALRAAQPLHDATRAVHGAGFWRPGTGLLAVREDVGRHNALDKLVGSLARAGTGPEGAVLLTSRVSVEMVQKSAALGAPVLIAVSAPTSRAVALAEEAGITLVARAKRGGEVFTHPRRITEGGPDDA